jgi:[protein-PII] uridylyltransferase
VVALDSPGLLARVARTLTDADLDIAHAIVASWPDGRALESFLVSAEHAPDAGALGEAVRRAATSASPFAAVRDARVAFDDRASPWYTVCRVRAADASGLLAAVTGAIAAAGIDVHSAEVASTDGGAIETFELTGARGKLLPDERDALVENLRRGGVLDIPPRRMHRIWERVRASWSSASAQAVDIQTSS